MLAKLKEFKWKLYMLFVLQEMVKGEKGKKDVSTSMEKGNRVGSDYRNVTRASIVWWICILGLLLKVH